MGFEKDQWLTTTRQKPARDSWYIRKHGIDNTNKLLMAVSQLGVYDMARYGES